MDPTAPSAVAFRHGQAASLGLYSNRAHCGWRELQVLPGRWVGTGWIKCSRLELRSKSLPRASRNTVNRGVEGLLGCRSGLTMCGCAPCGPSLRQFRWLPTADTVAPASRWSFPKCIGLDPPPPAPAGRRETKVYRYVRSGEATSRSEYTDH